MKSSAHRKDWACFYNLPSSIWPNQACQSSTAERYMLKLVAKTLEVLDLDGMNIHDAGIIKQCIPQQQIPKQAYDNNRYY
jgi:hypothetical protein